MRIFEHFQKKLPTIDNINFLKEEYGIGGSYPAIADRNISEDHSAKGINIVKKNINSQASLTLSWNQVANRIKELIEEDKYLSEQQKEYYPTYLALKEKQKQRSKISAEFKSIIVEFNDYMYNSGNTNAMLNRYVLSDCSSEFTLGKKTTFTVSDNGYILPIMREALDIIIEAETHLTDRCKSMLKTLEGELAKELEPDEPYENTFSLRVQNKSVNSESNINGSLFAEILDNDVENKENIPVSEYKGKNTFANSYEQIGESWILDDSDIDLYSTKTKSCYVSDINISFKRFNGYESIKIVELGNANKKGKECKCWSINGTDLYSQLGNNGIHTIKDLYNSIKEAKTFENIQIYDSSIKGVDVFSPFIEVKPLKEALEKWTKNSFIHAMNTGQIFSGEIANRYTDDYRYDNGADFCKGIRIDMSCAARDELFDWNSLTTVNSGEKTKEGIIPLTLHCCNITKNYFFDLNCDIAEGKRRRDEFENGISRYNKMMEASCKNILRENVALNEIYSVKTLNMNENTHIYSVKDEVLQGNTIIDRMHDGKISVIAFGKFPIENNKFYSVSNIYSKINPFIIDDERLIYIGNHEYIVSGKTLKEMANEDIQLSRICIGPYSGDYKKLLAELNERAEKGSNYGVNKVNYQQTINKLENEYIRSSKDITKSFSELINAAESKRNNMHYFDDSINKELVRE